MLFHRAKSKPEKENASTCYSGEFSKIYKNP